MCKRWLVVLLAGSLLFTGCTIRAPWPDNVSRGDLEYLRELMKETWHFIDFYIATETGLPYDSNRGKGLTNTTNIGLYLASLCVAYRLDYVTEEYAAARIQKILDSLDRFEHWNRLYNNGLDADGKNYKATPGESNISDYNKLPAALIVVRQTFPQFADRCTAFLDEIPWDVFYEPETGKMKYAFDVVARQTKNPVYFFRGEDKILGHFLAIASGKVPASSWEKHDLSEEEKYGYRYYKFGWQGGGLFMQFICDMFLDNRGTSLGLSSAHFAWAQIVHALKIGSPVWGWSASYAPNGQYLGMNGLVDEVVTPHASALAIHLFPRETIDNLRRLETFGLRKPIRVNNRMERFGFRDSVNWKNGATDDIYLILDQAMLFLSLANYVYDGVLWKTFDQDPMVQHGKAVIGDFKNAPTQRPVQHRYIRTLSYDEPGTFWLDEPMVALYQPGEVIRKSLWARSLFDKALPSCAQSWRIKNSSGQVIAEKEEAVAFQPRQTVKVGEVEVSTEKARGGESWVFESALLRGRQPVYSISRVIAFPGYQSLEGSWRLQAGDQPEWASVDFDDSSWKAAPVPERWDEVALPQYDGLGWYRLRFTVAPQRLAQWTGEPVAIAFGAIDDADETFLNGRKIGQSGTFGPDQKTEWRTPRVYEFDRSLLATTNVLCVRVADFGGDGGIWRGPVAIGPAAELRERLSDLSR